MVPVSLREAMSPDDQKAPLPECDGKRTLPSPGWLDSSAWGCILILVYAVLAAAPLALAAWARPRTGAPLLVELGRGAGLLGFALLALQVALSARLRPIERPFGLDVVMQVHRAMAMVAMGLLVAHPILLMAGWRSTAMLAFDTPWRLNAGKIALLLLVLVVALALCFRRVGMGYQTWRFLHKGAILVVILGFVHGLLIGSDLRGGALRGYWWGLFALAAGLFLFRNLYVPRFGRRRYRVVNVKQESHNTYTLSLQPEDGRPLPHQPGQFLFLKLLRPGRPSEEHPFTIASSPTEDGPLRVTIKESGDFTGTIGETRPGDKGRIEAPYGRFSPFYRDGERLLFIAGGVGITPLISMLRALRDTGDPRPVMLIYANRTERDILFRDELAALPERFRVVHVLSEPDASWTGLRGYVTAEVIERVAGRALAEAQVYLCGPPPMMDAVVRALRSLGVADRRIHYERFAL